MKRIHAVGAFFSFFFSPNEHELVKLPPRRPKLRDISAVAGIRFRPWFPGSTGRHSFIDFAP